MRYILEDLIMIPTPFVLLLLAGIIVWKRRRLSFVLIGSATALMAICSFPVTSMMLTYPLSVEENFVSGQKVDAVLIPTAGVFRDATGRWWSTNTGVIRGARASQLGQELDVPLIVSGGSPWSEPVSEAKILFEQLDLDQGQVILEEESANTWDTARAVSRIMGEIGGARVALVTSPIHLKRTAASLRAQGLGVSVVASIAPEKKRPAYRWVPSASALGRSRSAFREYAAILYYLMRGYIKISDLV